MPGLSRLAFIVQSGTLTGEEISQRLGLRPPAVTERGEVVSRRNPGGGRRAHTTWAVDSTLAETAELAAHLEALLPLIEDRLPALRQIQSDGGTMFWSCFVTAKPLGNMFRLEAELLYRLAKVGVPLDFDLYDSDETAH
ncbi:DUF4279 domain-containing protein [Dactylosporangium sp. CA-139066]|uniref:DUF4279 domain-containing protein n=1 Tax=Dactylosporangium sp. CA-139066 TaxID=3239930 RepID=UPI003D933267